LHEMSFASVLCLWPGNNCIAIQSFGILRYSSSVVAGTESSQHHWAQCPVYGAEFYHE